MTALTLHVGQGKTLELPIDAVTETFAILGIRGSGKTNTAGVIAEELLANGQQVVVVDPTDSWWGLKSSADGKSAGYPVVIMGGKKGDIPLAAGDGKAIADFVVSRRASVVLSTRHFESRADARRFITDFMRRLYHLKGQETNPSPLMVLIDECSIFVPQRVMGEDAACVGSIQVIARQGRSSGLGIGLIDQRGASVNKDVLSMVEVLICHRTTSPQDRKALRAWIEQHDADDRGAQFLADLATLPRGTAWVWSPGLLDVFKKVAIRERHTFDSSRTPKAGERVIAPSVVAPVDLDELRASLAATVEKAKADDPKMLRAQIAELQRQVRARTDSTPDPIAQRNEAAAVAAAIEEGHRAGFTAGGMAAIHNMRERLGPVREIIRNLPDDIDVMIGGSLVAPSAPSPAPPPMMTNAKFPEGRVPNIKHRSVGKSDAPVEFADKITSPEQRILDAIAWMESIGIRNPTSEVVAYLSDYSSTSTSFTNPRGALRKRDLIEFPAKGTISLTNAGRSAAIFPEHAPTSYELRRRILGRLPGPEEKILTALIGAYPRPIASIELAKIAGYSPTSTSFTNPRGRLRSLGFIEFPLKGTCRATDLLFPNNA